MRWMPSNCAYHVVSGLGLTRLEREPWSFWKARVLELDEVNAFKVLAALCCVEHYSLLPPPLRLLSHSGPNLDEDSD